MTLGPPPTGCCLRKSRGTSSHPIPAGGTPLPLPSPRLKLLLARVRVWLRGEDHKLESKEVAGDRPLIPEQEGTGPPPEDTRSKGGLQARIRWKTSWTSCPQVGRGTLYIWWDAFMPPKSPPSIPDNGTANGTSSFRPWKNVRESGWTLKNWHHSATCVMWPSVSWTPLAVT